MALSGSTYFGGAGGNAPRLIVLGEDAYPCGTHRKVRRRRRYSTRNLTWQR